VLDGGRGVAAVIVMLTHGFWTIGLVPTGALAVDYFFILSGLVLAYAYEPRFLASKITIGRFFRLRLIRLYPMIALGMTAAGLLYFASQWLWSGDDHFKRIVAAVIAGLLLIPLPRGFLAPTMDWMSPLNLPMWSLFFEAISNLLYAPLVRYITLPRLFSVVAISGTALALALWHHRYSSFGITRLEIPDGLVRLIYAFTVGLIIFRLFNSELKVSTAWLPLLTVAFIGLCSIQTGWTSDTFRVWWILSALIIMPVMVYLMAHMHPGQWIADKCAYLGRLSYPLYLIHYPVISFFNKMIIHLRVHGVQLVLMVCLQMAAAVVSAIISLHFFDEPVRNWLSRRSPRTLSSLAQEST